MCLSLCVFVLFALHGLRENERPGVYLSWGRPSFFFLEMFSSPQPPSLFKNTCACFLSAPNGIDEYYGWGLAYVGNRVHAR